MRAQDATQNLMTESMIEKADEAMDVMELEWAATEQLSRCYLFCIHTVLDGR